MRAPLRGPDTLMQDTAPARPTAASGFAAAVTAFLIWGLLPLTMPPPSTSAQA